MTDHRTDPNHGHRTNPFDENGVFIEPTEAPWTFELQDRADEPLTLESAVFQALGAASTCWESMEGTGIFQDQRAIEIGNKLVEYVKNHIEATVGYEVTKAIDEEREGQ